MRLDALVGRLAELEVTLPAGGTTTEITSVVHDTRAVTDGALFCCVPGSRVDGHDLAADAVARGAAALLCRAPRRAGGADAAGRRRCAAAMGPVADAFWDHPSRAAGRRRRHRHQRQDDDHPPPRRDRRRPRAGRPRSSARSPGRAPRPRRPSCRRCSPTPSPAACRAVAMEVSSHALALERVRGHPLRRRRLHEPLAGPPRLPPRHGGLLRREGGAVRPGLRRARPW